MKREEFKKALEKIVELYMGDFERYDRDPQIVVTPSTLLVDLVNGSERLEDIADSEEAVEDAAAADRADSEDYADFQARRDQDYYPVTSMLMKDAQGRAVVDEEAINRVVAEYFK